MDSGLLDADPATILQSIDIAEKFTGLQRQGERFAQQGQWDSAVRSYLASLAISPGYLPTLYGLARCAAAAGDTASEIAFYRRAIYSDQSPDGFGENNFSRLMEFALLLNQAGQEDESLFIYHRGLYFFNYEDGKPNASHPVPMPDFGPGAAAYTPERLQAMAQLAIGLSSNDDVDRLTRLKEAVRLAPDSPAANYYLGVEYNRSGLVWRLARPYYQRAMELGDAQTRALASQKLHYLPRN